MFYTCNHLLYQIKPSIFICFFVFALILGFRIHQFFYNGEIISRGKELKCMSKLWFQQITILMFQSFVKGWILFVWSFELTSRLWNKLVGYCFLFINQSIYLQFCLNGTKVVLVLIVLHIRISQKTEIINFSTQKTNYTNFLIIFPNISRCNFRVFHTISCFSSTEINLQCTDILFSSIWI